MPQQKNKLTRLSDLQQEIINLHIAISELKTRLANAKKIPLHLFNRDADKIENAIRQNTRELAEIKDALHGLVEVTRWRRGV